jgi:hypothetical protein
MSGFLVSSAALFPRCGFYPGRSFFVIFLREKKLSALKTLIDGPAANLKGGAARRYSR